MTAMSRPPIRQQSFVFEATLRCNFDCGHCYNVWKNGRSSPGGELPTEATLAMLDAMLTQTGARLVTVTGGEPLLRPDIFAIVDHLAARGAGVNFLTNGSLLDEAAIARLSETVSLFELPLLSARRDVHDAMSGHTGAFDAVTLAIASLKAARQRVVSVFVATRDNAADWPAAAELAFALGVDGIMLNRFNPGGAGAARIDRLQLSPGELAGLLDQAEALVERFGLSIACSIPMPPCLLDHARWPRLGFGFCAAGGDKAYYTLDPLGNVRPCNHSPRVLGNIRSTPFAEMVGGEPMRQFMAARPAFCSGCGLEHTCQGGCKAAAEACFGDVSAADPFLAAHAAEARKR